MELQRVGHNWASFTFSWIKGRFFTTEPPGKPYVCVCKNSLEWFSPHVSKSLLSKCGLQLQTHQKPNSDFPIASESELAGLINSRGSYGSFHESENVGCSVVSNSLQPHGLYSPWNSLGQNIGVGSHSLLQGIFPTQELNPGLLHCRWILYQLSHKENPKFTGKWF